MYEPRAIANNMTRGSEKRTSRKENSSEDGLLSPKRNEAWVDKREGKSGVCRLCFRKAVGAKAFVLRVG